MTSLYYDNMNMDSRSPSRSVASYNSPSRERSVGGWGAASSPTNSIASTMMTSTSIASTGVKTQQIRTLQMELEMKEDRIRELEEMYDSLEQRSTFQQGEMLAKVGEQQEHTSRMEEKQAELDKVIATQSHEIENLKKTIDDQKSLQVMMQQMMLRCQQLEDQQRADRERAEQAEAKRQAELEAARVAEEERQEAARKAEIERQEAAQRAEEEAQALREAEAARRKQEEEDRRKEEEEARQKQAVVPTTATTAAPQGRNAIPNRFRATGPAGAPPAGNRSCSIM